MPWLPGMMKGPLFWPPDSSSAWCTVSRQPFVDGKQTVHGLVRRCGTAPCGRRCYPSMSLMNAATTWLWGYTHTRRRPRNGGPAQPDHGGAAGMGGAREWHGKSMVALPTLLSMLEFYTPVRSVLQLSRQSVHKFLRELTTHGPTQQTLADAKIPESVASRCRLSQYCKLA